MLDKQIQLKPLNGRTDSAVVLLHGYGSDGFDMLSLAEQLQAQMPYTVFYTPNAPEKCETGYQWFDINLSADESVLEQFSYIEILMKKSLKKVPMVQKFIQEIASENNLSAENVCIGGFSQGGLVALMTGLLTPSINSVVDCSGLPLAINNALPIKNIKNTPPVLLTHGTADDVVPFVGMEMTENTLSDLNIPIQNHIVEGMGHGIDTSTVLAIQSFIKRHLG